MQRHTQKEMAASAGGMMVLKTTRLHWEVKTLKASCFPLEVEGAKTSPPSGSEQHC